MVYFRMKEKYDLAAKTPFLACLWFLANSGCVAYAATSPFDVPTPSVSDFSDLKNTPTSSASALHLTLVGVAVNGKERGNIEVLFHPNLSLSQNSDAVESPATPIPSSMPHAQRATTANAKNTTNNINNRYALSLADVVQLTAVTVHFEAVGKRYYISTPIGEVQIPSAFLWHYQKDDGNLSFTNATSNDATLNNVALNGNLESTYIKLSDLKKLGISAAYQPQDLVIQLNMGWQPSRVTQAESETNDIETPVDYAPSRAGLLGLSFDSRVSVSEGVRPTDSANSQGTGGINHQIAADIGAFGYAVGGVWGVNARGYDYGLANNDRFGVDSIDAQQRWQQEGFIRQGWEGVNNLPWDWQEWQIDNAYWVKSAEHFATRLGTNAPNGLGQGVRTTGTSFTGAMLAYSNRDIERHLTVFDHNSDSLLQNTSQDYQNFSGVAEPGGVAELRINGRAIARVQIALDGRYEFLNLDVNNLDLTETMVEIAIFAYPTAKQPVEVRSVFLGKRRTNTATGEWLLEAGLGRSGNLFDRNHRSDDNKMAAHLFVEHGLSNRLALRGGINTAQQIKNVSDEDVAWHAGINIAPSTHTNADFSYAHAPNEQIWQAQLGYQHKKLWADYQYQDRRTRLPQLLSRLPLSRLPLSRLPLSEPMLTESLLSSQNRDGLRHQRLQQHQLLLNYRPTDDTSFVLNQYYNDYNRANNEPRSLQDGYYLYASANHRFNEALNGGLHWNSRNHDYGYRLLWRDSVSPYVSKAVDGTVADSARRRSGGNNTLALSGSNDQETVTLRHDLNNRVSLGQSVSHLHGGYPLLYQGDIGYRLTADPLSQPKDGWRFLTADQQFNIGYSLYEGHFGGQIDWQFMHYNGVNVNVGYRHRYVSTVPSVTNSRFTDILSPPITGANLERDDSPWLQENYAYASVSFDMFKAPKQHLHFGRIMPERAGNVIVALNHPSEPIIDTESMRFLLNNQSVQAQLLSRDETQSQYSINHIKAGKYTLTLDAKNLPIEFSTSLLDSPYIEVSNYAPTLVPVTLEATYGISGKLLDAPQGIDVMIYRQDKNQDIKVGDNEDSLVATVKTSSYGYFQALGLPSGQYKVTALGYQSKAVFIDDDFVLQVVLTPSI